MAVDNWALLKSCGQAEIEKWRWCRGCKYLSSAGCSGCCDYLLMTGKRRPCPIGKDCTVREYKKYYQPSDSHVAWCTDVDKRLESEQRTQNELRRKIEQAVNDDTAVKLEYSLCKRSGIRSRSFDEEYAFDLYCRGFYISDIREILNVSKWINLNAIAMNEWRSQMPPGVQFQRHDIQEEKEKYLIYKAKLDAKKKAPDLQSEEKRRKDVIV